MELAAFQSPLFVVLAALVGALAIVESVWLVWKRGLAAPWLEYSSNLFTLLVGEFIRVFMRPWVWGAAWAASAFVPWKLSTNVASVAACFLIADFLLYAWHRFLHRHPLGWALHSVHHTGQAYSLALAGRLPWPLRFVDDFVCVPLVLVGFEPSLVLFCLTVNLVVQFVAHTEMVGRLPVLDWWFNTPSNHRVHHHPVDADTQSNYGGTFMLWDHLLGTYRREGPKPVTEFGLAGRESGLNPFLIQVEGLRRFWKERAAR